MVLDALQTVGSPADAATLLLLLRYARDLREDVDSLSRAVVATARYDDVDADLLELELDVDPDRVSVYRDLEETYQEVKRGDD